MIHLDKSLLLRKIRYLKANGPINVFTEGNILICQNNDKVIGIPMDKVTAPISVVTNIDVFSKCIASSEGPITLGTSSDGYFFKVNDYDIPFERYPRCPTDKEIFPNEPFAAVLNELITHKDLLLKLNGPDNYKEYHVRERLILCTDGHRAYKISSTSTSNMFSADFTVKLDSLKFILSTKPETLFCNNMRLMSNTIAGAPIQALPSVKDMDKSITRFFTNETLNLYTSYLTIARKPLLLICKAIEKLSDTMIIKTTSRKTAVIGSSSKDKFSFIRKVKGDFSGKLCLGINPTYLKEVIGYSNDSNITIRSKKPDDNYYLNDAVYVKSSDNLEAIIKPVSIREAE